MAQRNPKLSNTAVWVSHPALLLRPSESESEYSHLGDWIARQKAAESRNEGGAEARRLAAEDLQDRLKLILAGEPPYDIFVRWKPLEEQLIGWDPDLNNGVRVNIRPFINAGVLRKNPRINWKKDRGRELERPQEQYPWFWLGRGERGLHGRFRLRR